MWSAAITRCWQCKIFSNFGEEGGGGGGGRGFGGGGGGGGSGGLWLEWMEALLALLGDRQHYLPSGGVITFCCLEMKTPAQCSGEYMGQQDYR